MKTMEMLEVWNQLSDHGQAAAMEYMESLLRGQGGGMELSPVEGSAVTVIDNQQLQTVISQDMFERFSNYIDAAPKTVQTYTKNLRLFSEWMERNGITEPTREDIVTYKRELQAAGLKPTTVTNRLNGVKAFFQWTESEGIYPDITAHVKGGKISTEHKRESFTEDQLADILNSIDRQTLTGKRDYAIIALAATTGLRTVEISNAKIEDLRAKGNHTVLYLHGKGHDTADTPRQVYPEAERAIREYLAARGKAAPTDPLFISHSNRSNGTNPIRPEVVSQIIKARFRAAGYDSSKLTAHSLRHFAVTTAARHGEKMEQVQQFARHSRLDTTAVYYHEMDEDANTCVQTIGDALFKKAG